MIRLLLLLLGLLVAGSASAQTVSGCGAMAISRAEGADRGKLQAGAECFEKVAQAAQLAANARRERLTTTLAAPATGPVAGVLNPTPAIVGQVPVVASGLNVPTLLGPKRIPGSMAPDAVGAFRFLCGPGQVLPDDPIVYPGQAGRAHLHQFFGNLGANASSTYVSLRRSGDSTCMNALNRSAYWMPAMLDGRGNVVRPDGVSIYYKRRPKTDPFCTTQAQQCVDWPRGLRLIFGWDQFRPTEAQPENTARFKFHCAAGGHPTTPALPNMAEALKTCVAGQELDATIQTPLCWNGRDLDSPDHRRHVVDMVGPGYPGHCPTTHPMLLPQFTMNVTWSIGQGDQPTRWMLSSDHMKPGALPGDTFHSDYFEAWEDSIRDRWNAGCIDHLLNCSDGDLGDGQILARGRYYPSGVAHPRLVPVPR